MSQEAKYFRVGLFVLLGIALVFAAVAMLGGSIWFEDNVAFETYFDESVQGLEVGSAVKLRGVDIGRVKRVGFVRDYYGVEKFSTDPEFANRVIVRMELLPPSREEGTEIADIERRRASMQRAVEQGLRLRLAYQGLTGAAYVEADFLDAQKYPAMPIDWTPRQIYVPSAPSTLRTLSTAADRIFSRLETLDVESVVSNLSGLLDGVSEAVEKFDVEAVMTDARDLIAGIDGVVEALDIDQIEEAVVGMLLDLRATSATLKAAIEQVNPTALGQDVHGVLERLEGTLVRIQRLVDASTYDVETTVENMRVVSEDLRDLTSTAKSYPSLLLLGEPPAPANPGKK